LPETTSVRNKNKGKVWLEFKSYYMVIN
jgi:hypothetical protein